MTWLCRWCTDNRRFLYSGASPAYTISVRRRGCASSLELEGGFRAIEGNSHIPSWWLRDRFTVTILCLPCDQVRLPFVIDSADDDSRMAIPAKMRYSEHAVYFCTNDAASSTALLL